MIDMAALAAPGAYALLQERRSIRRYTDEPVSRQVLDMLLEAAIRAPSAHNRQPWRFAPTVEAERKFALGVAMGESLRRDRLDDGDDELVVAADVARSLSRIVEAPLIIAVCLSMTEMDRYPDQRRAQAEHVMAVQSTAMAAQNLLLAAHSAGLGACILCAPLFCPDVVRRALDLPPDWEPQSLLTVGYPAKPTPQRPRRPLDAVVRIVGQFSETVDTGRAP